MLNAVSWGQLGPWAFSEHPLELDKRVQLLQDDSISAQLNETLILDYDLLNSSEILTYKAIPILEPNSDGFGPAATSWLFMNDGNWQLFNQMNLNPDLANTPNYSGKVWHGLAGYTAQAGLRYEHDFPNKNTLEFMLGRFQSDFGPGRTGNLLWGVFIQAPDQVKIKYSRNNLGLYYQTGQLDRQLGVHRYFSFHRLQWHSKQFFFAASEMILYGSDGVQWEYLNPMNMYHVEQQNASGVGGNTLGNLEFRWLKQQYSIYSEILVDDIQFDSGAKSTFEPNELGFLMGVETVQKNVYISTEYVAITNRTYKASANFEWATHYSIPLGYNEGSDLWRWNTLVRYTHLKHLFEFETDVLARGAGKMASPWDTPWADSSVTIESGYSEPFPTGIVENSSTISLKYSYRFTSERYVSVAIRKFSVQNQNNAHSPKKSEFNFGINLFWPIGFKKDL